MDDMQMMLQQALQPKGQGASMQTMDPTMGEDFGAEGGDIAAQIQEQLQAIEQAFEQTQDPNELRQLSQAYTALQEKLQELGGGGQMPGQGQPPMQGGF